MLVLTALALVFLFLQTGCVAPIGADKTSTVITYKEFHANAISHDRPSDESREVLRRFNQETQFDTSADTALELIHQKALAGGERDLLFALSELNYLTGERVRRSVKPWEARDARDYYLASAVYAWLFLFGDGGATPPDQFDNRFRLTCDLYNYGLGWALTERRGTNAVAVLKGGVRKLSVGQIELDFTQPGFAWPLTDYDRFVIADEFLVRGLSVRNGQHGLGTPLAAVTKPNGSSGFYRAFPASVLLRLHGGLAELAEGKCRGTLELYSSYGAASFRVSNRTVPLETDTTFPLAYALNQSKIWNVGVLQFLSYEEKIPGGVYLMQPYQPGRVPVVFVHGTLSSPVWWAEMANTLAADPELRKRCQFWYFVYNSGNPIPYSVHRLREALTEKLAELDPGAKDAALRQMVVVGHSQGGLLAKLTATDTGEKLLQTILGTNRLEDLGIPVDQQKLIRQFTCLEALPFVKDVIFISTPHRGSYQAGQFVRNLARRFVTLPSMLVDQSKQLAGLAEKVDYPKELRTRRTSLDGMSPKNPGLLALADIPLAPGVKGHSIIAVKGDGDYHQGKDGIVAYDSAHVDYVASEFIVRSGHTCQDKPPAIEEVRRILHEHLASLPASLATSSNVK